ncbi:MAG: glycosyltransferase family 39 protein [Anaerolineae bacterium]|nr:glycosyltransferase family 39 protein [Anaerolineae bacterium]
MSLLAWPLTLLALVFMYPWARWLLRTSDRVLIAVTTLGLSTGTLSLVMLWIGLIGIRIDWRIAALVCAGISGVGWIVQYRARHDAPLQHPTDPLSPPGERGLGGEAKITVLIIVIIGALILFNAIYWPFGIDDAITIYATFGKQIANTGRLPQGNLYELYPMLVPLNYAFTHQAAGWIDEHLAALIPAALSVGVMAVAYLLGRQLFNRAVGLIAALLIALTPMYTHWASAGYVDLPAAFYYGLAVYFLFRLDSWQDALLAGIMAGLSAWTKNSGLLIVGSIVPWIGYRWWLSRDEPRCRVTLGQIGVIVAGFGIVAGPWYLRNWITTGLIVPPTGWTWKAKRTLTNLFPYLADGRYFPIGLMFTAGVLFALWRVIRTFPPRPLSASSKGESDSQNHSLTYLMICYVPFFVIWWALFSYDGRFLLVLTPLVAVMAAQVIKLVLPHPLPPSLLRSEGELVSTRSPSLLAERGWGEVLRTAAILLIIILALPAASAAVDYKSELLRRPFMSDADKHRLRLSTDRYEMVLYLRTLPAGSKVWTQDLLLPYHADGMNMVVGGWPTADQLKPFDYWVLSPGDVLPDWVGDAALIHTQGGYRVYALRR